MTTASNRDPWALASLSPRAPLPRSASEVEATPVDDEPTDCLANDPSGERTWPCGACSVCRSMGEGP